MMLKGKKTILRYPKLSEAKILAKEVNKIEISSNIAVHRKKNTVKSEKKWIRTALKQNRKKQTVSFVVLDKTTKQIIGGCGFNTLRLKDKYAIAGWWLKKEYWGQGYFQDFATVLLDYGFKKLKINKIDGHVFDYNLRSRKSIIKLGFKPEGVVRQNFIKNGVPVNEYLFGLLRKEWIR